MRDKLLPLLEQFRALDQKIASVSGSDTTQMAALSRERKRLEPIVAAAEDWLKADHELRSIDELMKSKDTSIVELASHEKETLKTRLEELEKKLVVLLHPRDPNADRNTIVEIRAGAGGDEAGLFVADLFRMFARFAQRKGLQVDVFSSNPTGVGGFKEVIFGVSGENAYGWFRFEQGVHRVQRVPATEAQGRIHTSTVTVAVLPEPNEVEIKVDVSDLRIDTYRASGAGGQHVNKTDSAVRITHIPTGIVVQCQEERSQGQNKIRAMSLLRAKLQETAQEKQDKERSELRRKQVGTGDRSEKIRTYNFPQDRITDHRINVSVFNIEKFLSGEMDEMLSALQKREEELQKEAE